MSEEEHDDMQASPLRMEERISEEEAQATLDSLNEDLRIPTGQPVSMPTREACVLITRIASGSPMPTAVRAAHVYMQLVAKSSANYDDVAFSACLHRVSAIVLEPSTSACTAACKRTASICSAEDHVSQSKYVAFWATLVEVLRARRLDLCNQGLVAHVLRAAALLLRHVHVTRLLNLARDAAIAVLQPPHVSSSALTCVYRTLFPHVQCSLLTANRNALGEVLISAARCEESLPVPAIASPVQEEGQDSPARQGAEELQQQNPQNEESDDDGSGHLNEREGGEEGQQQSDTLVSREMQSSMQIISFLTICCYRVIDRAAERDSLSNIIYQVLNALEQEHCEAFMPQLKKCLRSEKVSARLIALEVSTQLCDNDDTEAVATFAGWFAERCDDSVASVRRKAIQCLHELLTRVERGTARIPQADLLKFVDSACSHGRDEKSTVRKAAVEFIGFCCISLLQREQRETAEPVEMESEQSQSEHQGNGAAESPQQPNPFDFAHHLTYRCQDLVATVRSTAADQLLKILLFGTKYTELSEMPQKLQNVLTECIEAVVGLINDVDNRCQNSALEAVRKILFNADKKCAESTTALFLSAMASDNVQFVRHVENALFKMTRADEVTDKDLRYIATAALRSTDDGVEGAEGDAALPKDTMKRGLWGVLAAIAAGGMKKSIWCCLGHDVIRSEISGGRNTSAFKLALHQVGEMNHDEMNSLQQMVINMLFRPGILGAKAGANAHTNTKVERTLRVGAELLSRLQQERQKDGECADLGDTLLQRCEEMVVKSSKNELEDRYTKQHALYLIGNICEHMSLQKEPTETIVTFVQAMTSTEQANTVDAQGNRLRALALTTLGKMCLMNERLTRQFISVFVHELDNASSNATRNNAVLLLCDMCRQYTSIVEPFIPRMAALLRDPSTFVRTQVLSSLVCLLQEDYIKIRPGFVLFQIAYCLQDDCEEVRRSAEYSLIHVVVAKNKTILAVSFVELLFVLNECEQSRTFVQFKTTFQDQKQQTIGNGGNNTETEAEAKRKTIYEVFLRGMSAEQRWHLPARLRNDIIILIIEENMDFMNESVQSVLQDTLSVLSSDQILKPSASPSNNSGTRRVATAAATALASEEPTQEATQDVTRTATAVVVGQIQSVELRDFTIPLLLQLRHFLQTKRSPLLRNLNQCLCTLLHPHREQLSQFIPDPTTRSEIQHEMNNKNSTNTST